jgi:hypothetical protein
MRDNQRKRQVLSVNLSAAHEDAPFEFNHIELQGAGMRHRISPLNGERRLDVLLDVGFARFIRDCLDRVEGSIMVMSDVDALFRIDSLELRKLQLMRTVSADGTQKAVLRFLQVTGNVQRLFRSRQTPTQAETRAIALEAIEGVVGRSYDVTRVYESVRGFSEPQGEFDSCAREIKSKRDELLFRLDLLQRAVAARGAAPPDGLDPDWLSLVSA